MTVRSCSSWACRRRGRAHWHSHSSRRATRGSIATRAAGHSAAWPSGLGKSSPPASRDSLPTTPTPRASPERRCSTRRTVWDCACAACGSTPASRTRKPTPSGGWCRATDVCSSRTRSGRPQNAILASSVPACCFATSGSSSRPTRPRGSSRSSACRSCDRPTLHGRAARLFVKADGVLRRSLSGHRTPLSPDDLDVPPGAGEVLRRYANEGYAVMAIGWRPEIVAGTMTSAIAAEVDAQMIAHLGLEIETLDCTHPAGPPLCWCRKPLPGLGVVCVHRHRLDPARCIFAGAGPQDPGFARRCGFQYVDAEDFF